MSSFSDLDLDKEIHRIEIGYFLKFQEFIRQSIDEEKKIIDESWTKFEKENKGVKTQERDDYLEYLIDQNSELKDIEQIMFKSYVVSIFTYLEKRLVDLCNSIYEKRNIKFQYKELQGAGVGRLVRYIEKTLDRRLPNDEEFRDRFTIATKIRNTIVHAGGDLSISSDKDAIIDFAKKESDLFEIDGIEYHSQLKIRSAYLNNLTETVDRIINEAIFAKNEI